MNPRSYLLVLAIVLLLGNPYVSRADTIQIVSGVFEMQQLIGTIELVGTRGFTLHARGMTPVDGFFEPSNDCGECPPEAIVRIGAGWSGHDLPGSATLDGRTYPRIGGLAEGTPAAAVTFGGAPVVAPQLIGDTGTASGRFVFSGLFTYPDPAEPFPDAMLTVNLVGRGTATLSFRRAADLWEFSGARYEFDSPAAVPEPTTVLLLGGGLAAMGARAHRRARRAREQRTSFADGVQSTTPF